MHVALGLLSPCDHIIEAWAKEYELHALCKTEILARRRGLSGGGRGSCFSV